MEISEAETAVRLNTTTRTLQRWRAARVGPRFCKIGRTVRYPSDAVEQFIKESVRETSGRSRRTRRLRVEAGA